jgi:predicted glycoside hydrolase/deacetylase ChbG (UPF0249 family)
MNSSLVINADDFGFTPAVNRGIVEAVEHGIVTSVSMLVHLPGWSDAVQLAHARGDELDVGLHFNTSVGTPLTPAASLVDQRTGEFASVRTLALRAIAGRIRADDVYTECMAQAHAIAEAGITISHLDGHLHVHLLPGVWEGVVRAARDLGNIPVRIPREIPRMRAPVPRLLKRDAINAFAAYAVHRVSPPAPPMPFFGTTLHGDDDYLARIRAIVAALAPETTELMVHPGYPSGLLPGGDTYDAPRERELRALMSAEFRECLADHGVELRDFRGRTRSGALTDRKWRSQSAPTTSGAEISG